MPIRLRSTPIYWFGIIFGAACWISVFIISLFATPLTSEEAARAIERKLNSILQDVDGEADRLQSDTTFWEDAHHSFFLLKETRVERWTTTAYLPDQRMFQDEFKVRLVSVSHGDYIIRKYTLTDERALLAVIPLKERYKIENSFLRPTANLHVLPSANILINDIFSDGAAVRVGEVDLFKVVIPQGEFGRVNRPFAHVLWWLGLFVFTITIASRVITLTRKHRYTTAFLLLATFTVGFRLLSLYGNFPGLYSEWVIFDPRIFASSLLNPSLADLFLNTLVVWVLIAYLFFTYSRWKWLRIFLSSNRTRRYTIVSVILLLLFFAFLFPFLYVETLFHNSTIYPDVTQSPDLTLSQFTAFVCVAFAGWIAWMVAHMCVRLAWSGVRQQRLLLYMLLLAAATLFILFFLLSEKQYGLTTCIAVLFVIIAVSSQLHRTLQRITFRTFVYLITSILLISFQNAYSVRRFAEEERLLNQFRFANEFLVGRDYLGEYLLSEALITIKEDPFIQNRLTSPFSSKTSIREKVRQIHLSRYFDRYDIAIHLFDFAGRSLDNQLNLNLPEKLQAFENENAQTGYDGVFLVLDKRDENAPKYIAIIAVRKTPTAAGYVVLELSLKRRIPTNVYPELFVDNRFAVYQQIREVSYAVFLQNEIESSFGSFNYDRHFDQRLLLSEEILGEGVRENHFLHIAVPGEDGRMAVVSSPEYPIFYVVGNFGFWSAVGVLLVLLGLLLEMIRYWRMRAQINYSSRIQLYFYLTVLLPLLVVGATTLSITTRSAKAQLNANYLAKARELSDLLANDFVAYMAADTMTRDQFSARVNEVARITGTDVSVFDATGELMASSQPLVYDYQFKSPLLDYHVLKAIVRDKESTLVKDDQIGSLVYNSAYASVRSPQTGEVIGVISLPFFQSASYLQQSQITIFINIITIFTSVIIVFSLLSVSAAHRLTLPLRIIARSLRKTSLSHRNEPLLWKSNDEMGVMVKGYNQMVANLEASKQALEKSQKESAWREIARQVAHEIKNPLTPIKLTLQQMEQWLKLDEVVNKERSANAVKNLLEQVDILNNIASSFGTFARMPTPVMTRINLETLLKGVVALYEKNMLGDVSFSSMGQAVWVSADEQLLTRVFSNLILNALQAGREGEAIHVDVELNIVEQIKGKFAVVKVKDNGQGIPKEVRDRIFTPYFTTKKSGSGLGLAIVKQGVGQCGGVIDFKTVEGEGTVFEIELPVID